jgi:hypothetical protein
MAGTLSDFQVAACPRRKNILTRQAISGVAAGLWVLLAISTSVLSLPAKAQGYKCAVYLEKSQVCMRNENRNKCIPFNQKINRPVDKFQCLIRDTGDFADCQWVYIAANTVLLFDPPRLRYRGLYIAGSLPGDFYSEDKFGPHAK